jgi:hypothetical protein
VRVFLIVIVPRSSATVYKVLGRSRPNSNRLQVKVVGGGACPPWLYDLPTVLCDPKTNLRFDGSDFTTCESRMDIFDRAFLVERLGQEANCPRLERARAYPAGRLGSLCALVVQQW